MVWGDLLEGVSKKVNDSEIRRFRAHKSLLCLSILNGVFILDAKVCLGTVGNICVSLQCTLELLKALQKELTS